MENTKVENISDIKLDFFLRQNKKDVRVVLKPGDISWCDVGSTTKSMILYARKNLITIHDASKEVEEIIGVDFFPPLNPEDVKLIKPIDLEDLKKAISEMPKVNNVDDSTAASGLLSVQPMSKPDGLLFTLDYKYTNDSEPSPLEKAEEETKRYVDNKEEKEEKKYKGKKRGRKKKRGPKPGSKRKKATDAPTMIDPKTDDGTHQAYSD